MWRHRSERETLRRQALQAATRLYTVTGDSSRGQTEIARVSVRDVQYLMVTGVDHGGGQVGLFAVSPLSADNAMNPAAFAIECEGDAVTDRGESSCHGSGTDGSPCDSLQYSATCWFVFSHHHAFGRIDIE